MEIKKRVTLSLEDYEIQTVKNICEIARRLIESRPHPNRESYLLIDEFSELETNRIRNIMADLFKL